MSKILVLACIASGLLLSQGAPSKSAQNAERAGGSDLSGRWVVSADFYGTSLNSFMQLIQQGDKLTGNLNGDKLEGTINGNSIHFLAKDEQGNKSECTATLQGDTITGTVVQTNMDDLEHPSTHQFTARLAEKRPTGPPQRHEFTPTVFYRQFSPFNKPVLTIAPGDTIHTTTVDAGGTDEKGVTRVLGGNPETGPFYIVSALPGDTLVVHIVRLRLNRDWAGSDDSIVERGMDSSLAVKMKDAGKSVRWHLDMARGVAFPEKPGDHMAKYTVPLRPMLGCVATATNPGQAPPGTGDSGGFGGNMDFNEIVEGATVYLPVRVPGALLYFGDGHAAQGDGELTGNALETSMDVEVTVDVMPHHRLGGAQGGIGDAHHGGGTGRIDRWGVSRSYLEHGPMVGGRLQADSK